MDQVAEARYPLSLLESHSILQWCFCNPKPVLGVFHIQIFPPLYSWTLEVVCLFVTFFFGMEEFWGVCFFCFFLILFCNKSAK